MPDATKERILKEVRALREEVADLKAQQRRDELPRLQAFADELGISRSTMYAKLERRGSSSRRCWALRSATSSRRARTSFKMRSFVASGMGFVGLRRRPRSSVGRRSE